eukprot:12241066-Alexandrium_andersonii.AAC.1
MVCLALSLDALTASWSHGSGVTHMVHGLVRLRGMGQRPPQRVCLMAVDGARTCSRYMATTT